MAKTRTEKKSVIEKHARPEGEKTRPKVKKLQPVVKNVLEIKNLHAEVEGMEILKGINLTIKSGEIHAVMGPNGSGKSTLCNVLMGHPKYEITKGSVTLNGTDILELAPNERANSGIFLGFQHPLEIPGVTLSNFLRLAKNANIKAAGKNKRSTSNDSTTNISTANTADHDGIIAKPIPPAEFLKFFKEKAALLKMDEKFIGRSVNEGFSGGERKRAEIVQMAVLEPKIALLDEIDSGLDIDALKIVAKGIKETFETHNTGILIVTHYQRILNYITPHFVHIISQGKIVKSGNEKLAQELEEKGYQGFIGK